MEDNLIMLSSVTYAMKARDLLRKNNINSMLVRTPVHLKTRSCGYSLYVPNQLEKAVKILGSKGITILGTAAVGNK
ncbi:MAG: DUF3343 domain-containing protein [Ruminococcus sp.]|nr:DUF3343 domain-containing protein [Ruminococcus sp.]